MLLRPRWEYQRFAKVFTDRVALVAWFDELGQEGWEVISFANIKPTCAEEQDLLAKREWGWKYEAYCKRPVLGHEVGVA